MYFNLCITGQQKVALNDRRAALCEVYTQVYPTSKKPSVHQWAHPRPRHEACVIEA